MCDLRGEFRLCSCNGDTLKDPDWILERHDPSLESPNLRGMAVLPHYSRSEQEQIESALVALRQGEAFDFDYAPMAGDVLQLRADTGLWLRFRFNKRWEQDTSNGLTGWRYQMVPHDRGSCAK